jgi:ABC-2 type transport system permease protein
VKSFRAMLVANLKMNVRNRTALFWNLAFPLIFILLFGFLFSDDVTLRVGVSGEDTSPIAQRVTSELRAANGFRVTSGSTDQELKRLADGDRTVVLIFSQDQAGQPHAEIVWDESNPQLGQIAVSAVRQFLLESSVAMTGSPQPIGIDVRAVSSSGLEYMDFLVPGILAMSLMNSGMIGLASAFVTYREKGILRRIRATPFPLSSFIAARIASQLVVSVAQAVVLITVGILVVGLTISGNLLNVFVMVIIGSLAFLSLGFVISAFARNQEAADSLANGFSFPMLFLSGVFFPVDSAPSWLQPIMRVMPLRYLVDGLRNLMVRDGTLPEQWLNILVMLATGLVGFLLALRFFRWESSTT